MAALSSLIWAVVTAAIVFVVFKWYLPHLMAKPQPEGEEKLDVQITKKFKIFFYVTSVVVALLCGYFSGARQDAWLSVSKMVLTLGILNVISITDIKLYKIPNLCVLILLGGRCLSFIPELINNDGTVLMGLINSLIAGIVSLLFLLLMSKITRGGIGYGDVKLFGALGFLCGVRAVLYTLMLSFFLCAIVSAVLLLSKKKGLKDGLPMGPFIWIGFAITIILGLC